MYENKLSAECEILKFGVTASDVGTLRKYKQGNPSHWNSYTLINKFHMLDINPSGHAV